MFYDFLALIFQLDKFPPSNCYAAHAKLIEYSSSQPLEFLTEFFVRKGLKILIFSLMRNI